jgi:general secretion pathway protein M
MEALRHYWAGRSGRERLLLMVAAVLAAALLGGLLLRPVLAAGGDAAARHQAAVEREGRFAAKLELLRAPDGAAVRADAGGDLAQILAQSAGEVGLTLSRNEAQGRGARIAIAGGKVPVVMGWIGELETQGFVVEALDMTPQADGTAALTADVRAVTR